MAKGRRRIPTKAKEPPGDGGPDEAACFIAGAVSELVPMARLHRLAHLAYLLDLAKLEAEQLVRANNLNSAH